MIRCRLAQVAGILAVVFFSTGVVASWDFSPTVTAELNYKDNLFLDSTNEVNDLIYSITPGFELTQLSRRLRLNATYSLEALHYQRHSRFDDQYHGLNSNGQLMLLDKQLFVDMSTSYSQADIDLDRAGSGDNLSVTDNRTDVKIWNLSPYWQHQVGNSLFMEVRYGHRRVIDLDTTKINSWSGFIQSLPGFGPISFSLDFSDRRQDYEFNPPTRFKRSNLRVTIPTWPHQRVIIDSGYEKDDYQRAAGTDVPSGGTWALGYGWNLKQRSSFEVTWGQRFFGDSIELHGSHGLKRWTFNLDYSEDPSTNSQSQIDNASTLVGGLQQQLVDIGNQEVFIQKRLVVGVHYAGQRNQVNFRLSRDKREFQTGTEVGQRKENVNLNWQRDLNSQMKADISAEWLHRLGAARDYREWKLSFGLERSLSSRLSVFGRVLHSLRDGRPLSGEYRENTFKAGVKVSY